MKDLLDFQNFKIQALQDKVCELNHIVNSLQIHCFELCDKDCPEGYKLIVKKEIYTLNKQ